MPRQYKQIHFVLGQIYNTIKIIITWDSYPGDFIRSTVNKVDSTS